MTRDLARLFIAFLHIPWTLPVEIRHEPERNIRLVPGATASVAGG
jgi:hypothetical protein